MERIPEKQSQFFYPPAFGMLELRIKRAGLGPVIARIIRVSEEAAQMSTEASKQPITVYAAIVSNIIIAAEKRNA
jgi:hypothetical protein